MEGQKDYIIRRRKQQEMQKKEQQEIDEMKRTGIKRIERSVSVLVDHSIPLEATVATRKNQRRAQKKIICVSKITTITRRSLLGRLLRTKHFIYQ